MKDDFQIYTLCEIKSASTAISSFKLFFKSVTASTFTNISGASLCYQQILGSFLYSFIYIDKYNKARSL